MRAVSGTVLKDGGSALTSSSQHHPPLCCSALIACQKYNTTQILYDSVLTATVPSTDEPQSVAGAAKGKGLSTFWSFECAHSVVER